MPTIHMLKADGKIYCYVAGTLMRYAWCDLTARNKNFGALDITWEAAFDAGLLAYDLDSNRIYCKEEIHA